MPGLKNSVLSWLTQLTLWIEVNTLNHNVLSKIKCTIKFSKVPTGYTSSMEPIYGLEDYVVYMYDDDEVTRSIKELYIDGAEADLTEDILGVCTSRYIRIVIEDYAYDNKLLSKKDSTYNRYLNNGIELKLEYINDEGIHENRGTYYLTDWSAGYSDGVYSSITLKAANIVDFIGQRDIDELKLKAYNGTHREVLDNIFGALGLKYYIRGVSRKQISNIFGITTGMRVGEVLDELCKSLLARIVVDFDNNILIVPSLTSVSTNTWLIEDKNIMGDIEVSTGLANDYSDTVIIWKDVSGSELDDTCRIRINKIASGETYDVKGVAFYDKAFAVDSCYIDKAEAYDNDGNGLLVDNIDFEYNAYQGGIDLHLKNNLGVDISNIEVVVEGHKILSFEGKEKSKLNKYIDDDNFKVSYELRNDYIQKAEDAKEFGKDVSEYLERNSYKLIVTCYISPYAKEGDNVLIKKEEGDTEFNGEYKIVRIQQYFSDYKAVLELIYNKEIVVEQTDAIIGLPEQPWYHQVTKLTDEPTPDRPINVDNPLREDYLANLWVADYIWYADRLWANRTDDKLWDNRYTWDNRDVWIGDRTKILDYRTISKIWDNELIWYKDLVWNNESLKVNNYII